MIVPENVAKQLLSRYGLAIPAGRIAVTPDEAVTIAQELGNRAVVKAVIPAGGRGKAGGVKVCQSLDAEEYSRQVHSAASGLLGQELLGCLVERVLVEELVPLEHEIYAAVIANTAADQIDLVLSLSGGVEIESTTAQDRQSLYHLVVQPGDLLPLHRVRQWLSLSLRQPLKHSRVDLKEMPDLPDTLVKLYRAAADLDALLLEINPLALTANGGMLLLDCKLEVDDNSLSRQPELNDLYLATLSERELRALKLGVSYVPLEGVIGVITSGAGLGMATMDLLQQSGMAPANFLDTGGGISVELVKGALELVLEPPQVRGVIINLYGGINRMLKAAKGIQAALRNIPGDRGGRVLPVVVKILGNQQEEAWAMLEAEPNVHVIRTVQTETAVERLANLLNAGECGRVRESVGEYSR